jgi:hypothetical protein
LQDEPERDLANIFTQVGDNLNDDDQINSFRILNKEKLSEEEAPRNTDLALP